ncbi:MAG TPA: ABC transporter transmembrane domain-containing protein, partial [Solirubrobacteraceae bacterium]|nr:ABC transporter transmembrane domain-containing protein [Solirubrobacteraceae bacterium]
MRGENTRALWRVRPYLRPYVPQLAAMVVISLAGIGAGLLVPLVIRRIIDGPIARGDQGAVLPLAALVLVLGLIETGLSFLRRWIQSGAANGFERDLRNRLYAHLQSLPASFHDRWHSGQ